MSKYDSTTHTLNHIKLVKKNIRQFCALLNERGELHDLSKLKEPEKSIFDKHGPSLSTSTYGSAEYKLALTAMGQGIRHHYQNNPHHPEHHTQGISGMTLIDIVEMYCDWLAAVEAKTDGDIFQSLAVNKERFAIDEQLYSILLNTIIGHDEGGNI